MCSTLSEPIVHRDPGDETDFDPAADPFVPDVHDDPSWSPESAARFGLDMPRDEVIFVADEAAFIPDDLARSLTLGRPSTAPNADRIEALENREAMTRDALNHLNDVATMHGSDLKALSERITALENTLWQVADGNGQIHDLWRNLDGDVQLLRRSLEERTDRIARSLTHLALAVTELLKARRTLGQRFAAWWGSRRRLWT